MDKKITQRVLIILALVAVVVAFKFLGLGQYLTLSYLKESQAYFAGLYVDHQVLVIIVYMVIYIVVTALSLPGAAVLTLAGGGLFATLACFVSRFLLREWVQNKFMDKLHSINKGIEEEGALYLFSLRLVPIFPFFVINLVMGLTSMRLVTFYWVSQLGMLAGTMVYVNAGKELAKIESVSGILSPGLIISFVILGLFPIAVKKLLAWYKARREN